MSLERWTKQINAYLLLHKIHKQFKAIASSIWIWIWLLVIFFSLPAYRRKKGKGNKSTSGTTLPEAGTSSEVPQSEAAGAPNPSSLPLRQTGIEENAETPGDTPHVQTSQSNSTADAQVSSSTSVPGSVPSSQPSASQVGQTSCTPLNSPSNLYAVSYTHLTLPTKRIV